MKESISLLWNAKANGFWYIYALELVRGRYYIGITRSPKKRIAQHSGARRGGARYTKIFRPKQNIHLQCLYTKLTREAKEAENKLTLEYMKKYGVEYVRGGDYIQSNPDKNIKARWLRDISEVPSNVIELDRKAYEKNL